jgi:MYXO-CTERM domain-containing protein
LPSVTNATTWSAPRLVNDIDLSVSGPSGMYLGNVFTNGSSSTGGMPDKRNNVEQVLIATPMAGTYTITVTPVNIVQGNQDFALVVVGAFQNVGGSTDGGTTDAPPPTDAPIPPPPSDVAVDQEASTPTDAPPSMDVARPDGTAGAGGSSGSGGTGGGGAGAGGTAGRGGTAGTAGRAGSAGAAGGVIDAGSTDAPRADTGTGTGGSGGTGVPPTTTMPPPPDDGCSCSIPQKDSSPRAGLLGFGIALAAIARRRRR